MSETETVRPLDETARRKPGFREDDVNWILLANGQEWAFPKPVVKFHYTGKKVGFGRRFSHGPEYEAIIGREAESPDFETMVVAQLELAAFLIRMRYDLTDEEIGDLIEFTYEDDPDGSGVREAILATAYGFDAPKPSPAGNT